ERRDVKRNAFEDFSAKRGRERVEIDVGIVIGKRRGVLSHRRAHDQRVVLTFDGSQTDATGHHATQHTAGAPHKARPARSPKSRAWHRDGRAEARLRLRLRLRSRRKKGAYILWRV